MSVRDEFDSWAAEGRDRGMEERHWHIAKHVPARMPVEPDDTVLDLGTGSGYALRALREAGDVRRGYGLDGAPEMLRNARSYADDPEIGYVRGDFGSLPFADDSISHVFSMKVGGTITYSVVGFESHDTYDRTTACDRLCKRFQILL